MTYSYQEKPGVFPYFGNDIKESIERRLRVVLDFIMFSSTYVAIAAVGMVYTSCFIQGIHWNVSILMVMALVSFSVYNLNRKTDEEEDEINHQQRFTFTKKFEKPLFYTALTAYGLALIIGAYYGFPALVITTIPLISGILYSVPLLPAQWGYRRLKEIPVVKNLVVALAWSLPLSLLPVYMTGVSPGFSTGITLLFFASYVFIASILPDIRDREGDAITGVRTIPVTIGVKLTKVLLIGVNVVCGCMVVFFGIRTLPPAVTSLLLTAVLYTQFCIWSMGRLITMNVICDFMSDGQFILFGGGIAFLSAIGGIL